MSNCAVPVIVYIFFVMVLIEANRRLDLVGSVSYTESEQPLMNTAKTCLNGVGPAQNLVQV